MTNRTIITLILFCAWASAQPFGGKLEPGGHLEQIVSLGAQQFASLAISRDSGDLQVSIRADGVPVREVVSTSYSVAPVGLVLWTDHVSSFQIVVTNSSRTEVTVRASVETPRAANARDRQQWDAEEVLYAPPAGPGKPPAPDPVGRLRNAAEFFEKAGDPYKQASALRLLGNLYTRRQDYAAAREQYTLAAGILKQSAWRFEESVVRQNLANAISETGDDRAAIAEMGGVLAIRAELHDDLGRGIALFGRARSYWHMGELQRSLDDYRLALTAFRKLGEARWEATVRNALGLLQAELGQTDAARSSYAEASAISRRLKDQSGLMMATNNVGMLKESLGQHTEARSDFQEALRLCQALGNRQAQAYILQNIADVSANEGDHPAALKVYEQSLDLKRQLNDVRAAAETKRKMGLSYLALGQTEAARSSLNAALEETRSVSDRTGEAQSLAALARLESVSGTPKLAEERIAQAVRLIETTRVELRTRDLRTSYFSTQRDFYDLAIDLAMDKGGSGAAAAFEWSERQRARTLLDAVRSAGAGAADPAANVAGAAEIRRDLLDRDETLVEYSGGPLRTWAWVVTASQVRAVRLPGWDALSPVLARMRQAVEALQEGPASADSQRRLDDVLKEVAARIWWPLKVVAGTGRVAIAADAGLEQVPFAALPAGVHGPRLIEQVELAAMPSASLVAAIRRNRTSYPRRIAIFADPVFSTADLRVERPHRDDGDLEELVRLRFSREEAQDIGRRAGGGAFAEWLDFRANLDNLRRAAGEPGSVLHLATHAIVDDRDPAASRLVVSRVDGEGKAADGELRINDIYNLRIRRQLVVLSACRAAWGPEARGEGMLSLTRAFLYAGAKGVVASLWRVGDRASAELMRRFYEGLMDRKRTPAEALRFAQLGMMKDPRWSGVENWASFLFSGDWRITPWGPGSEQ